MKKYNKILIIDDNKYIRYSLNILLKENSYKVDTVIDRENALMLLKSKKFDLIFLDIKLPDCDGLNLLLEIKKEYPCIPIIMLTAYGDKQKEITSLKLGADAYITKPYKNEDLLSMVNDTILNNKKSKIINKEIEKLTFGKEIQIDKYNSC